MHKIVKALILIALAAMVYISNTTVNKPTAVAHVVPAQQFDAISTKKQNSNINSNNNNEAVQQYWQAMQQAAHSSNNKATRSYSRHVNATANGARIACIIARENGGDYGRSSNPTHFGKYQFSRATWQAYGGNPNSWGTASPQEQDAVFANAINSGGISNWTNYDKC